MTATWAIGMRVLAARCGRAPSAHNTQPWVLRYEDAAVAVHWDEARSLPASDPTGRDLLLGLGAYLETCLVVAADAGIGADVRIDVDREARRAAWLVPADKPYPTGFTAADVAARHSARGTYEPGPLPAAAIDELNEICKDVDARFATLPARDLTGPLARADRWMFGTPDVTAELRAWLRLRPDHPRYRQDGLTDRALGLSRFEAAGLDVLLRPRVYRALRRAGLPAVLAASGRGLLRGDGTVVALIGPADAYPEQLVALGRSLMRSWLALGVRGMATHPLSQLLDCPHTAAEVAALLGLGPDERPVAVFRAGRPQGEVPRSARRSG